MKKEGLRSLQIDWIRVMQLHWLGSNAVLPRWKAEGTLPASEQLALCSVLDLMRGIAQVYWILMMRLFQLRSNAVLPIRTFEGFLIPEKSWILCSVLTGKIFALNEEFLVPDRAIWTLSKNRAWCVEYVIKHKNVWVGLGEWKVRRNALKFSKMVILWNL